MRTWKYSPLSHMGDSTVSFLTRWGATSAMRFLSSVMVSYGSCLPTYCTQCRVYNVNVCVVTAICMGISKQACYACFAAGPC